MECVSGAQLSFVLTFHFLFLRLVSHSSPSLVVFVELFFFLLSLVSSRSLFLFVCLCFSLSACMSACLSIYLFMSLSPLSLSPLSLLLFPSVCLTLFYEYLFPRARERKMKERAKNKIRRLERVEKKTKGRPGGQQKRQGIMTVP